MERVEDVKKKEKKKQGASSSDSDTFERGIVHRAQIFVIVSTKSWVSVVSSDDDDEFLPRLRSTSLTMREC